jgi:hypothetical protein
MSAFQRETAHGQGQARKRAVCSLTIIDHMRDRYTEIEFLVRFPVDRDSVTMRCLSRSGDMSVHELSCVCCSPLTRHGALSSKPAGAFTLSVCPLKKPVSLRSRSITVCTLELAIHPLFPKSLMSYSACPIGRCLVFVSFRHSAYF